MNELPSEIYTRIANLKVKGLEDEFYLINKDEDSKWQMTRIDMKTSEQHSVSRDGSKLTLIPTTDPLQVLKVTSLTPPTFQGPIRSFTFSLLPSPSSFPPSSPPSPSAPLSLLPWPYTLLLTMPASAFLDYYAVSRATGAALPLSRYYNEEASTEQSAFNTCSLPTWGWSSLDLRERLRQTRSQGPARRAEGLALVRTKHRGGKAGFGAVSAVARWGALPQAAAVEVRQEGAINALLSTWAAVLGGFAAVAFSIGYAPMRKVKEKKL